MIMAHLFYFPLLFLIKGYRRSRSDLSSAGQALLETTLVLPLIIFICILFFVLIYDQIWTKTIEHTLHEALVCEKTLTTHVNSHHCLQAATQAISHPNFMGQTIIYKISHDYYAELKIFGNQRWKIIHLSEREQ